MPDAVLASVSTNPPARTCKRAMAERSSTAAADVRVVPSAVAREGATEAAALTVPAAAVLAALMAALAVHGLFDFGWHVPALPLTAALLLGLVTFPKRKEEK